jgi:hypothetical protein
MRRLADPVPGKRETGNLGSSKQMDDYRKAFHGRAIPQRLKRSESRSGRPTAMMPCFYLDYCGKITFLKSG